MEKEISISTNDSIEDMLSSFVQNSLLLLADINGSTLFLAISAVVTIIGSGTYLFHRVKDSKVKEIHYNNIDSNKSEHQTKQENYGYHKILNEFHNACNNCSSIFSSMKCVQLTSNYPELINVKLFSDGVTPFHRVCFHGNEPLIELMLAKGADPELKTVAGENALCMALYHYLYTEKKDFSCLNKLYQNGCYLKYGDEWYEIFLNLAIKNNNEKLTKWLLTHSKPRSEKPFARASSAPL